MDVPHIACQMAVKLANGELVTREVALVLVRLLAGVARAQAVQFHS